MWPFDEIRWHFDDRRRLRHIKVIVNAARDRNIELSPYVGVRSLNEWNSNLERSIWFHPVVEKLTHQRSIKPGNYTLEFFTQKLVADSPGEYPKYVPTSTLPEEYFSGPIGQVPNPDYPQSNELFNRVLESVWNKIYKDEREREERKVELEKDLTDKECAHCHGEKGIYVSPSYIRRHPVSGFPQEDGRWTADEEEWEECRYCKDPSYLQHLDRLKLGSEVFEEMARRKMRKPAKNFPVYIRIN